MGRETETTLWERVDRKVLEWVHALPPTLERTMAEWDTQPPETFDDLPEVDGAELHASLQRLRGHGLIDGDGQEALGGNVCWLNLRVTAEGLILLGEWPDIDRMASAAGLHRLLTALSTSAPEEERGPLKRTAGLLGRTADDVLRGTLNDVAGAAGKEAVD